MKESVFRLLNVAISLVGIFNIICSSLQGLDLVVEVFSLIGLFIVLFIIVPIVIYALFIGFLALFVEAARDDNVLNGRPRNQLGPACRILDRFVVANVNFARRVGRRIVGVFRRRR